MRNINIARDPQRSALADEADAPGPPGEFSPAEFLRDAGAVIVVCLALGLLVQLLLG